MLAILKGYDDFLVDWAFTELPQSHHRMKAQHRGGKKIRTNLPNCFVIVCQGAKDITSLLEERSCQNHNAWAASASSASFGSIFISWKKMYVFLFRRRIVVHKRYATDKGNTVQHSIDCLKSFIQLHANISDHVIMRVLLVSMPLTLHSHSCSVHVLQ